MSNPGEQANQIEKTSQRHKGEAFRTLHQQGVFISPNPWDVGSALMLEGMGFPALATTSSGYALTLGRRDGQVSRAEKLAHCAALTAATNIPISADLENGFGDAPEVVAKTIELAAAAGLSGGSIEDYTGDRSSPLYPASLALERIAAAVEAANRLEVPFLVTARAEQMLRSDRDLDATIARLVAFEQAGAHVLYAPGLNTLEEVAAVVSALTRPVNVLISSLPDTTVEDFAELGVRRLSVGGALAYATVQPLIDAGQEMLTSGRFSWLAGKASAGEVKKLLNGSKGG